MIHHQLNDGRERGRGARPGGTAADRAWLLKRFVAGAGLLGLLLDPSGLLASEPVWLDQLPFGLITDPHGPPKRAQSFNLEPLRMGGTNFAHGLSVHAPSDLHLALNGQAEAFEAWVGLDDLVLRYRIPAERAKFKAAQNYVYDGSTNVHDFTQGGTVIFRVLVDGQKRFASGRMDERSAPQRVRLNLRGAKTLRLVVETVGDGSFADLADWADARLIAKSPTLTNAVLQHAPDAVLINHVGYLPGGAKQCLAPAFAGKRFTVRAAVSRKVALRGELQPTQGDWGEFRLADFSALREPGEYFIEAGDYRSASFRIGEEVYRNALEIHLGAFLAQRCGDPDHGWNHPCHLDEGRRLDNGQHQDVRGGWHDAGDLRKWGYTVTGLNALTDIALKLPEGPLPERVIAEALWGNRYFQAMQEPAGYVMSHVGGDVQKHGDSNRWTDNLPGNDDDRVIQTAVGEPVCQFLFIASQARLARLCAKSDPAYAEKCQEAAQRCFHWARTNGIARGPWPLGAALSACAEMARLNANGSWQAEAEASLAELLKLQETAGAPNISGFFFTNFQHTEPAHNLHLGNWPLLGLVAFVECFPQSPRADAARAALARYLDGYLLPLQARNPFGLVPYALYDRDPGGGRRAGRWFYRWCYVNNHDNDWWNGINPHLTSTGVGLVRAARLLNRPELTRVGQRQLDFVYGANPFNASFATGIGRNQPVIFKTSEFKPLFPDIPGAIMAGVGSTRDDAPVLHPGWWQTCEYWTPPLAGTMTLLVELTLAAETRSNVRSVR